MVKLNFKKIMDLYATCCSQKMLQNFRMQEGWKRGMEKIYISQILIKRKLEGFPGGAVVESPLADAGDAGSSRGLGRSHMPRSNWAREPQLLSLRVWSLCSATGEAR